MVACKGCEALNSLDSVFCKRCGLGLPEESIGQAQEKLEELLKEGFAIFNEGRTDEAMMVAEAVLSDTRTGRRSYGDFAVLYRTNAQSRVLEEAFLTLRIPHVLHDELRTKLGGDNPDAKLRDWYEELDAEVERSKEPIPDVFKWLRPKFEQWATASVKASSHSELVKMLEAGSGR